MILRSWAGSEIGRSKTEKMLASSTCRHMVKEDRSDLGDLGAVSDAVYRDGARNIRNLDDRATMIVTHRRVDEPQEDPPTIEEGHLLVIADPIESEEPVVVLNGIKVIAINTDQMILSTWTAAKIGVDECDGVGTCRQRHLDPVVDQIRTGGAMSLTVDDE
jgi:hypothetical protein